MPAVEPRKHHAIIVCHDSGAARPLTGPIGENAADLIATALATLDAEQRDDLWEGVAGT